MLLPSRVDVGLQPAPLRGVTLCAAGFNVWAARPSCRFFPPPKDFLKARNRLRPLLHSLAPVKDGQLGFAKLPLSVERSLASRAGRSLRPSRFGASTQLGRNGPVPSVRSRDRAKGPSRAATHPLTVFLRRGGRNEVVFEIGPRGPHRCGVRGLRSSAQSGGLVALLFLLIGGFPRPSSRKPARAAAYSFSRLLLRPLPAALLPAISVVPGIDIIHFAHR